MMHMVKDYEHLKRGLKGFSEKQIAQHLGVYAGYVGKINEIEQRLAASLPTAASATYNDYSELKRREAVALNGALLHELYFESLGTPSHGTGSRISGAIRKSFGSIAAWERDVRAAATSTSGWVLLTYSSVDRKLHNYILEGNHTGLPLLQTVLLAVDCWEHAYMIDYGTAKQDYLTAVVRNLNWSVIGQRLAKVAGEE